MISCLQCSYLKLISNDYGNDTCPAHIITIISLSYDANNYRTARKFRSHWHNVCLHNIIICSVLMVKIFFLQIVWVAGLSENFIQ